MKVNYSKALFCIAASVLFLYSCKEEDKEPTPSGATPYTLEVPSFFSLPLFLPIIL